MCYALSFVNYISIHGIINNQQIERKEEGEETVPGSSSTLQAVNVDRNST